MKNRFIILSLGMLPFIMVLGNSMFIPILPEFSNALQISATQTSLLLSFFNIPAALVIPIAGFLSDRFGRKTIILWSLAFMIAGGSICFASGYLANRYAYEGLLFGRILQGIGAGGTSPLAMSLAGDLFQGEMRAKTLAVLEVFNGTAKIVAPVLGAFMALAAWFAPFSLFPILGAALFLFILTFVKTAPSGKDALSFCQYAKRVFLVFDQQKAYLFPLYLLGGTGMFLLFGMLYDLAYFIEDLYQIDGFFKGFVYSFPLGALTISSSWTGKRLKSLKSNLHYLMAGMVLMFCSFIGLLIFQSFPFFLFFLTIAVGGLGFMLPPINTLITSSVNDMERGIVVSLYGMARFLGVALGPVVFGLLIYNRQFLFSFCFLLLLISQSIFLFVFRGEWEKFNKYGRAFNEFTKLKKKF